MINKNTIIENFTKNKLSNLKTELKYQHGVMVDDNININQYHILIYKKDNNIIDRFSCLISDLNIEKDLNNFINPYLN